VIGKPLADFSVLQLAHAYDEATRWVKRHLPPVLNA
jgi:amidase